MPRGRDDCEDHPVYEAEGILPAASRHDNGYRDYSDEGVCRVRLVVALRGLGLDLSESGRLAQLCVTGRCNEMTGNLANRLAERRAAIAAATGRAAPPRRASWPPSNAPGATGEPQQTCRRGPGSRTGATR